MLNYEIIRPSFNPMNGGFQSLDGLKTKRFGSSGGGGLQSLVPSTCFVLEASNAASYPGSGTTWANVVDTPADGNAKTLYDVQRGDGSTSTGFPTFNGTAGVPGAYFSNDGGDYFQSITNPSPGVIGSVHRTDAAGFWFAYAWRFNDGATNRLFANAFALANYGFTLLATTSLLRFVRHRNTSTQDTNLINSGASFVNNTNYLVIVSMNAARTNFRFWKNTRTASNMAPSAAWTPVTSPATYRTFNASSTNLAGFDPSGVRYYGQAGGNDYIDDTAAGHIFDYFNASTGITFS